MSINLLIIGHVDDPEFTGLSDLLGGLGDVTVEQMRSLADYWRACAAGDVGALDLIIVLERHPDEHAVADVNRLIERHPLARIICGYGPWSESAARTRAAWPPAAWVPAVPLREQVLAELSVIRGERPPLAITADRADAFERRYAAGPDGNHNRPRLASLKVAVDAPDPEYRSLLEDDLRMQRADVVEVADDWDLLLFDAHPETHRMRELQRLLSSRPRASGNIVVLHELPSAPALDAWSKAAIDTELQVRIVSKLAPFSAFL